MALAERMKVLAEKLEVLRGQKIPGLELPLEVTSRLEPRQVTVLVNALIDALLPTLKGIEGLFETPKRKYLDRDEYPDYDCPSLELEIAAR